MVISMYCGTLPSECFVRDWCKRLPQLFAVVPQLFSADTAATHCNCRSVSFTLQRWEHHVSVPLVQYRWGGFHG